MVLCAGKRASGGGNLVAAFLLPSSSAARTPQPAAVLFATITPQALLSPQQDVELLQQEGLVEARCHTGVHGQVLLEEGHVLMPAHGGPTLHMWEDDGTCLHLNASGWIASVYFVRPAASTTRLLRHALCLPPVHVQGQRVHRGQHPLRLPVLPLTRAASTCRCRWGGACVGVPQLQVRQQLHARDALEHR